MKFGRRVVLIAVSVLICLGCVSYMPQKAAAQTANQFVVFINPGHGNSRTGSGNVTKGVKESLINEQVAVKLYNELTAAGVKVYSTNPIEIAPSIPTIIKGDPKKTNSYHGVQYEFATELLPAINTPWVFDASVTKKPDLVISIHHNSYGTYPNAANGYEVYYSSQVPAGGDYDWYGKDAKTAQGSKDIAGLIDSQFRSGGYAYAPRVPSVKDDLKVNSITRYSGVPSVLVEVGFMSNANDFANMRNDAIQQDTAKRIAKAAIEYKGKHNDITPPVMTSLQTSSTKTQSPFFSLKVGAKDDQSGVDQVLFYVWNRTLGTDKMKTYIGTPAGDGTWSCTFNAVTDFQNQNGIYDVHIYATDKAGNKGFFTGVTYEMLPDILPPTAKGANATGYAAKGAQFHAAALGVSDGAGVAKVEFAVWNQTGDLKWYNAQDYHDGNWGAVIDIKNHQNREGIYQIHAYATDYRGNRGIVASTTYNAFIDNDPPTMKDMSVTKYDNNYRLFHAAALSVKDKSRIKSVEFAVWNQPDDIKWYSGADYKDGNWGALVNIANHKNRQGNYTIHVYGTDMWDNRGLMGTATYRAEKVSVPPTTSGVNVTPFSENGKDFHAAVLNVASKAGVAKVEFAVWNQPDDLKWYNGTDYKDGNWGALVNTKDHLNRTGTYTIHAYATDKSGNRGIVGVTTFIAEKSSAVPAAKSAVAEAYNGDGNILYAKVLGVTSPLPIQKVEFAVWNDSAKYPTVKWYTADDYLDGNYGKLVYISDFGGEGGKYCVHTYVTDATGQKSVVGTSEALMVGNGYTIMGANQLTAQQLVNYYKSRAVFPTFYAAYGITIESFCQAYIDECVIEGIRPEVAFAQMCLETNYLKYTGDVKIEQFNFGGIGATGNGNPGNSFASAQIGIRAQVQHLKAYASTDLLVNPCVDPRFQYVQRGCAPTVELLSRKWATSDTYGKKILVMIEGILNTPKAAMENLVLPSATPSVTPKPSASAT
ncbi:MAG: GBS Bsp-like repeat-containing protein, partial [Christensenellaceae bacterium]